MSGFLNIPGFGAFNLPLPDAIGHFVAQGVDLFKTHLLHQAPSDASAVPVSSVDTSLQNIPTEPVASEAIGPSPEDSQQNLVIHLTSSHSQLLAKELQAQVAVPIQEKIEQPAKTPVKEKPKVEAKKQEEALKVAVKEAVSKSSKKSKHHHHSHHSHSKKIRH